MKKSKCFQKYGLEWSKELTETTIQHFESMFSGYVKHVTGKNGRFAVEKNLLSDKHINLIPEEEMNKEIFLFTLADRSLNRFDPEVESFDTAYNSVEDMIDDGWAVD